MQYRLADHSLVFSTRDRGARMRADLLEKIAASPYDEHIVDFDGVLSASYSFIDEFIGELAQSMGDAFPEVIAVPPAVCRTIERSLSRRGLDVERILSACLHTA
jgi:STAS-like domain of unknown function (DUF4325)